jgi:hypothetical protein
MINSVYCVSGPQDQREAMLEQAPLALACPEAACLLASTALSSLASNVGALWFFSVSLGLHVDIVARSDKKGGRDE